jgi:uncharacterized protein with von Willebrand factor type A (vWA) domain
MALSQGLIIQTPHTPRRTWRPMTILLLDISGSMESGSPRRIDLLWKAVQALKTPQSRWRVAIF